MAHEQIEDIIPLYAIGALDRHERQIVEAHLLTGCAVCHAALKDYHAVAGLLPFGLSPIPVPPEVRKKTISAALQSGPRADEIIAAAAPRQRFAGWIDRIFPSFLGVWQPALTIALMLLLAGTGIYAWIVQSRIAEERDQRGQVETALQDAMSHAANLQQQVTRQEQALASIQQEITQRAGNLSDVRNVVIQRGVELDQLRRQLAQVEKDSIGLRRSLAQRDEMLTFLKSAHVKVVPLAGLETATHAGAFLMYDRESHRAFFYAFNMPPLPPGKTYQLWAIVDKPVSAGIFSTDDGNKSRLIIRSLPDLSQISKFAVSVEPEGGRPQPTGDIYLAGPI